MESSLFARAKNAFHTAAAKAERALTEFKEDLKADFGRPTSPVNDEPTRRLPWSAKTDSEKQFEEKLRNCILNISKNPGKFLFHQCKEEGEGDVDIEVQSAKAILECDEALRNLRFHYVPKTMKEHEFWNCYFIAADRVKQEVLNTDVKRDAVFLTDNCNLDHGPVASYLQSESPRKDPIEEDEYKKAMSMVLVPSSKLLRKLAAVIEVARSVDKFKDLEVMGKVEKNFSQAVGLVSGLAAVKNSFLRESKDSKTCSSEEIQAYLRSLFEADTQQNDAGAALDGSCHVIKSKLPEEIHGAPPKSFVAHLAEIMGGIGTGRRMAEFWSEVVSELRRHWDEREPIPGLPLEANPDLRYCLLHQKLQVINCCIARQKRHDTDLALLDALCEEPGCMRVDNISELDGFPVPYGCQDVKEDSKDSKLFAKGKEGELLLRLGADSPAANLRMLETGEQVYSPVTQEGPVLTEDLIKETEELILKTGSVGAGCSHLLSDMQAFKAANPGCILEDFVRWYSPLDWRQDQVSGPSVINLEQETQLRGHLSARMQSEGNLWQELWASAKPIPAAKQAPLFDEDLAVESTLDALEDIEPADLFEQLFKAILGAGFAISESSPLAKKGFVAVELKKCKEFILATCRKGMDAEELGQLCQVYETMESILQYPSEELQDTKASTSVSSDAGGAISMLTGKGSKYYSLITNDRSVLRRLVRDQQSSHPKPDSGFSIFTRILEAKSSLFDKKPSQAPVVVEDDKGSNLQEHEWTLV